MAGNRPQLYDTESGLLVETMLSPLGVGFVQLSVPYSIIVGLAPLAGVSTGTMDLQVSRQSQDSRLI
jgi:hypothetical protein